MEMAYRRRDIESKITGLSDPISEHLIKILMWEDPQNNNKHINDVNKWFYSIQRLYIKGNKKPTQTDYFNWMFNDVIKDEHTFDLMVKGLHEYHHLPKIRKNSEVFNTIKNIFYQISYDLPLNKFVDLRHYIYKYLQILYVPV